jgi:RNA polymerase sigma-70 factor (ECF subfamily)
MDTTIEKTFDLIYKEYYHKSVLFVKSYVHDTAIAMDITSDSLIKLWDKMQDGEISRPEILLISILKNKALDHLKHESIKAKVFDNLKSFHQADLNIRISTLEACEPELLFSSEIRSLLTKTLDNLPSQTKEIFMLGRFRNKSNKEIAELYGISVKAVEYHITKTIKILRVVLKDYLISVIVLCILLNNKLS